MVFFVSVQLSSANSGDPDQMQHCAASDLGLRCLPITSNKKDIWFIFVKTDFITSISMMGTTVGIIFSVGLSEIQSKKEAI